MSLSLSDLLAQHEQQEAANAHQNEEHHHHQDDVNDAAAASTNDTSFTIQRNNPKKRRNQTDFSVDDNDDYSHGNDGLQKRLKLNNGGIRRGNGRGGDDSRTKETNKTHTVPPSAPPRTGMNPREEGDSARVHKEENDDGGGGDDDDDEDEEEEVEITFDDYEYNFGHDDDDDNDDQDGKRRGGPAVTRDPFYQGYSNTLQALYGQNDPTPLNELEDEEVVVAGTNETDEETFLSHPTKQQQHHHPQGVHPTLNDEIHEERLQVIHEALHPKPTGFSVHEEGTASATAGGGISLGVKLEGGDPAGDGHDDDDDEKNGPGSSSTIIRSLAGRYQPRRKRYFIPKPATARNTGTGANMAIYRPETQQEIQERVQALERTHQRDARHRRWKQRLLNLQDDEDVGQAFAARAQTFLLDRLRQEKRKRRQDQVQAERKQRRKEKRRERREQQRAREEQERLQEEDQLEEEDSVHEQNHLLSQLTDTSVATVASKSQSATTKSAKESENSLNYWEEGYAVPRKHELSYNYNPSVQEMMKHPSDVLLKSEDVEEEEEERMTASFAALTMVRRLRRTTCHYYFPPDRMPIASAGYAHGHLRQMLAMAARALCGESPPTESNRDATYRIQNRYIHLLCSTSSNHLHINSRGEEPLVKFGVERSLATYADELGQNLLLYVHNSWNDAEEVARRLGLLDARDTPLSGQMMTIRSITSQSKKIRSKVKKDHQKCSRDWDHTDNGANTTGNEMIEETKEEEQSSSLADDNQMLADIPSSDGVVLPGSTTVKTDIVVDLKDVNNFSEDARDVLVAPNCLYAHTPGTNPPAPQCPLDPVGILFGPVDRHCKFYRSNVKMSLSSLNLILSTLLQRVGLYKLYNDPDSAKWMTETQQQITDVLEEYANTHLSNLHYRYGHFAHGSKDPDIPLVILYLGVSSYCSFIANGCPGISDFSNRGEYLATKQERIDDNDEALYGDDNNTKALASSERKRILHDAGMDKVAEQIWDFCRTRIDLNGMLRFPKTRVSFALAKICRRLPPSAAEILSRPLEDDKNPLELFRETLIELETSKVINDTSHYFDDISIHAGELEYIFYDAANTFQEAIKLDSLNVDYHLWHIGCLASCLLLSSGNKIGSGARIYPSQKQSLHGSVTGPAHEIRTRLKKYKDVRAEVCAAVSLLTKLAQHQQSSRAHYAVVSLLEWGEVVSLMVGVKLPDHLDVLRRVHYFHAHQWAKKETSSATIQFATEADVDVVGLSMHARQLENDPTIIENWRGFVEKLGQFGKPVHISDVDNLEMHRQQCPECSRLCLSRWMDHSSQSTEKAQPNWWGNGRDWWTTSVLYIPSFSYKRAAAKKAIIHQMTLKNAFLDMDTVSSHGVMTSEAGTDFIPEPEVPTDLISWLPAMEDITSEPDNLGRDFIEARSLNYLQELPKSLRPLKLLSTPRETDDATRKAANSASSASFQVSSVDTEVLALKVFILGHLFGVDHPSLVDGMHTLGERHGPDGIEALLWLVSVGLDVRAIIQDRKLPAPTTKCRD